MVYNWRKEERDRQRKREWERRRRRKRGVGGRRMKVRREKGGRKEGWTGGKIL